MGWCLYVYIRVFFWVSRVVRTLEIGMNLEKTIKTQILFEMGFKIPRLGNKWANPCQDFLDAVSFPLAFGLCERLVADFSFFFWSWYTLYSKFFFLGKGKVSRTDLWTFRTNSYNFFRSHFTCLRVRVRWSQKLLTTTVEPETLRETNPKSRVYTLYWFT